jgi:hypothetical protein
MQSLRRPVSEIANKCTKLVMDINHTIEKFEVSKKDKFSFLALSQAFDRKIYEISILRARIDELGERGRNLETETLSINVPYSDTDGVALKADVIGGTTILASTLDEFRGKLDGVENQVEEIREEARQEIR